MMNIKTAEERTNLYQEALGYELTELMWLGRHSDFQKEEIKELRAALGQAHKKIAELEAQIGWISDLEGEDAMYESIMAKANQSYMRHKYSTRGQIITNYDELSTHIIHAAFAWKEAQTPAKPEQEPVAWRHSCTFDIYLCKEDVPIVEGDSCFAEPLYTKPSTQGEINE